MNTVFELQISLAKEPRLEACQQGTEIQKQRLLLSCAVHYLGLLAKTFLRATISDLRHSLVVALYFLNAQATHAVVQ